MLVRFRVFVLMLYIQTSTKTHIGRGAAQTNTSTNDTSPIVRQSVLQSPDYHRPNQISSTVRIPHRNSVRLSSLHGATYLPTSITSDGVTQSTDIALASSVPISRRFSPRASKITSASKDEHIAQKTETLRTSSATVASARSVRASKVYSDKASASELVKSTQSSHIVNNISQSYYSRFPGETRGSASIVRRVTRTARTTQSATTVSVIQSNVSPRITTTGDHLSSSLMDQGHSDTFRTKSLSTAQISRNYQRTSMLWSKAYGSSRSSVLYSKTDRSPSSLINPRNSETFRTSVLHGKSLSTAEISRNYQRTTGSLWPEGYRSSVLYSETGEYSRRIIHTISQTRTFNTSQEITPTASGHVSYLSKVEHTTLGLTNILSENHQSITPTTLQNTPHTNMVTRSSDIVPTVSETQTVRLKSSIIELKSSMIFSTITRSSHSMRISGATSRISEKLSSPRTSDDRKEKTQSSSHFTVQVNHSSLMFTTSVIKYLPAKNSSGRIANIPLFVLAICLPIGFLVGFFTAFVYIKRSKQDQRARYSVTVEIASEDPNYTMKRMYSIIDMNAGNINKDYWSSLQSDDSSGSIGFELTKQSSEASLQPSSKDPEVTADFPV